ncbi:AAA family ATPase [Nocardioides immobilis]|uniref:AAA family ATPase n=1 Tax=Nocardioides immobilis TaxID=2049295 RepID=A0A417XUT6_9ACTN|nr:MobF family relaxase [Nocardioides immobilis]RHW24041.1 AAA family ATPase [Nocardioides immobilis]
MRGGVAIYRGSAAAARNYVEADRSRADDYYLAEGTGVAARYAATPSTLSGEAPMDGESYERWVAGYDVETGAAKGRLVKAANGVRFAEVVVNGPKTWSLAAALDPEISEAYDAAQSRAAEQIIGWVAQHATTRVGPRDLQVQVPVERIEAAVIRHHTSRTSDPHRHLHLQVNARVFAEGKWRGLHTVGMRDMVAAVNGIGHAAVMCDPQFRTVLAQHGFTLDEDGEINELAPYAGAFSARSAQVGRNLARYEAEWRRDHPDQEPGPKLLRSWDRRAWADARPDKVVPTSGEELRQHWVEELRVLGFVPAERPVAVPATPVGALDREAIVEVALSRLGAKRSAWNAGDIRGAVEELIAQAGVVAEPGIRADLAEDLTARAVAASRPLLARGDVPEHVRALTSDRVLAVEAELNDRLSMRAEHGSRDLVVVEGAAGAGKTTRLRAQRRAVEAAGNWMIVVTPTLKAAQVAADEVGASAFSAAWLVHQHGFRWDADGHWTRVPVDRIDRAAVLMPGDELVVDEAGMLDQDTARALLTIADETGARVVLLGDRHQLPAVGRGGVLDLALRWAPPEAVKQITTVHRFTDPTYADLSLQMRSGGNSGEVFDALLERGEIVVHASEVEAIEAITGVRGLVLADTREQVTALNAAIRAQRADDVGGARNGEHAGEVLTTHAGEVIGVGDRVATRRNDRDLGVANRDTWTVTKVDADGSMKVRGRSRERTLPAGYVRDHVELAYATTVYGAQGETVDHAHLLIGETTGAAAAYVGMTRGRKANTAHLVADSVDDARAQWVDVFARDRADLGPAHAAGIAAEDIDRYGPLARQRRAKNGVAALQAAALNGHGPRRPREPIPGPRPAPDRGIGIGI